MTIDKKHNLCDANFWKSPGGKLLLFDVLTKEEFDESQFKVKPQTQQRKGEDYVKTLKSDTFSN